MRRILPYRENPKDDKSPVRKATYLQAWKLNSERGMEIPSNVDHDDLLMHGAFCWKRLSETGSWEMRVGPRVLYEMYPSWVREIIAHPKPGEVFRRGFDVVDSITGWRVAAEHIPLDAVGIKNAVLLIDPKDFEIRGDKTTVLPGSVFVKKDMVAPQGRYGKVDEKTRLPSNADPNEISELPEEELRRFFYSNSDQSVRPIIRVTHVLGKLSDGRHCIYTYPPGEKKYVAGVVEPVVGDRLESALRIVLEQG